MTDIVIKVENLTKVYPIFKNKNDRLKEAFSPTRKKYHSDFYALNNVSFEVKKGETIGIIGQNGSGKSTLLKILSGVLTQTSGSVTINGRVSALLELGAGFNPEMTGLENIYLNGTIMGYSNEEIEHKVEAIANFADIGDFLHQPVKTYSSGMFARLAFAVAINVEPEILIVDEALSVGDIFFQLKCFKKFNELREKGTTIFFVTHDLSSIIKYCNRVIVLNNGIIASSGEPKEMVDFYKRLISKSAVNIEKKTDLFKLNNNENVIDNEWRRKANVNPKYLNYGNGFAEIYDYAIFNPIGSIENILELGKDYIIKMRVRIAQELREPIFAMTIKDKNGLELTGTNTLLENRNIDKVSPGEIYEISFNFINLLLPGNYFISLGCTGYDRDSQLIIYHRLYDILGFQVISDRQKVGIFDMHLGLEVKKIF